MPPATKKAKTSIIHTGVDTEGRSYNHIDEVWAERQARSALRAAANTATDTSTGDQWYSVGHEYWNNVPATDDGVLGGFGHLSAIDVRDSTAFIRALPDVQFTAAIDCGAGIGRVAENLLCPLFQRVDLVEQSGHFVEVAKQKITHPAMKNFFTIGLQDFTPTPNTYDCVWVQWVMSQLTDADFVDFLVRCQSSLTENGYICLKENTAKTGFVLDCDDMSVTRSDELLKSLIDRAGLTIVRQAMQTKFPKDLFTVRMYGLKPKEQ